MKSVHSCDNKMKNQLQTKGITAGLFSAVMLGLAPIFGKLAMNGGFSPLILVAFRSGAACLLLLTFFLIFKRKFLAIYPIGFLGCAIAGLLNGVGSILYYTAISRMDASIAQLLYSFYPLFVAFWLLLDKQKLSKLTLIRLIITLPGVYLLLGLGKTETDWIGTLMILGSAILYSLHLIINQRILFEVPAPTVTLYTLLSMFAVTLLSYLVFDRSLPIPGIDWWPLIGMAIIVFLSRLSLFVGVKHLGGLQTSILGLGELLTTIVVAHFWLGESLSSVQWIGAVLLAASVALVGFDKPSQERRRPTGWLAWLKPPEYKATEPTWEP
jgi:drug/metabolite transporter (DMT)-like permease